MRGGLLTQRREDEEQTQQVFLLRPSEHPALVRDCCTLVMVEGSLPGQTIGIREELQTLGRGSKADVQIDDPGLSRVHAELRAQDGRWLVSDLGSTNGTWINGARVEAPTELSDSDRLQLGKSTTFRVSIHDREEQRTVCELYESAVSDPLTKLHNRRHLDDRLEGEFAYAERHKLPLSLLLVDVDHFKKVNDSAGHPAGDAVLRAIALKLKDITRTEDVVARYGGEEFAVIARGIDADGSFLLAERIRSAIEGLETAWDDQRIRVTVSIGVANHLGKAGYQGQADFLEAADKALYEAKNQGRNRSVVATLQK